MIPLNIRDVLLGQGKPKVCIPIMIKNPNEIEYEINNLKDKQYDLIEFRADYFKDITDFNTLTKTISKLRNAIDKPILFTFRSYQEGGKIKVNNKFYFKLNKYIINTRLIDIIDVELNKNKHDIKSIIKISHKNNIKVLLSKHDLKQTPKSEEIISKLISMEALGADITKFAVSAKSSEDVINVLKAANDMKNKYSNKPFIVIAMNGIGTISRICGEIFGSCLSFASLEKSSAPGQIDINNINKILDLLHNQLIK